MTVNRTTQCPNCLAELNGPYCSSCGQRQLDLERPFGELAREAMDAFLSFDSRILKTLAPLILRPGLLTTEFLSGRQKRYIHPFKLYFAASVALFLALSMSGFSVIRVAGDDDTVVTTSGISTGAEVRPNEAAIAAEAPSFLDEAFEPLIELMERDPARLNQIFTDRLAKAVILLVPVFALLLKLFYWKRRYVAQLVFSLHLHTFAFIAMLVGLAVDLGFGGEQEGGPGDAISVIVITVYTFLALRRVFGQGRFITVLKMAFLLIVYLVALIVTMILALAMTVLTI